MPKQENFSRLVLPGALVSASAVPVLLASVNKRKRRKQLKLVGYQDLPKGSLSCERAAVPSFRQPSARLSKALLALTAGVAYT
jgi:hypothetical protein